MDFDNRKVYGDTSITDGLVFFVKLKTHTLGGILIQRFRSRCLLSSNPNPNNIPNPLWMETWKPYFGENALSNASVADA